jgi:hypothetical protein
MAYAPAPRIGKYAAGAKPTPRKRKPAPKMRKPVKPAMQPPGLINR